ncbi:MAG: PEP-CTERM sorting domain-containing protein [Acidobacteriaceae bacterium]|nr:PEP-CTERM sorting domain-containing protein [Acidobacteriaceae bacterium]
MGGTSDGSVYGGRCTQVVFDVRDGGSEIGVSLRGCPMGWPTSPIECPTTPSEWTWLYGGAGFSDVVPNQPGFYYDNGDRAGTYGDGVTGETLLTINWDLATIPEPSTFGLAGAALALAGLGYRKHRSTLADTTVSTAMKTQRR